MGNLICVTENWLVQGFAWYKIVKIIIASEKFIVYINVLRVHEHWTQRYTWAACFTLFPTCYTQLIYMEKEKENIISLNVRVLFRIVFCRLPSLLSSLPPQFVLSLLYSIIYPIFTSLDFVEIVFWLRRFVLFRLLICPLIAYFHHMFKRQ